MIPDLGGDTIFVVEAVERDHLRHTGRRHHPGVVKVFTSTHSRHVREVVASSREGGASLNILSGLVAGNFSAYWLGLAILRSDGRRISESVPMGLRSH